MIHEPFNANQPLGPVQRAFNQQPDAMSFEALDKALAGRSIKHCYEYSTVLFNRFLFDYFSDRGYVQVFLSRRNEVERQVSLAMAKATQVWGAAGAVPTYEKFLAQAGKPLSFDETEVAEHTKRCGFRTNHVLGMLYYADALYVDYDEMYCERFADTIERFSAFAERLREKGLTIAEPELPFKDPVYVKYFQRGRQKSQDYADALIDVSRVRDVVESALRSIGHFPLSSLAPQPS